MTGPFRPSARSPLGLLPIVGLLALLFSVTAGCPDPRRPDDDDTADDDDTGTDDDDDDTGTDDDDDATGDDDDDDDTGDDDDDTVDPDAPTVTISTPADEAVLNTPDAVSLVGSATDPQDGDLDSSALAWTSSEDGPLGSGESLVVALSVGAHSLTLTATDSDGNEGSASVDVTVTGENEAPQAFIDAPTDGSSFIEGDSVTFEGHADDPEDGVLPGASLFWSSSEDGALGTGSVLSAPGLSLGPHSILLSAVDSQGESALATITITIAPVGSNLPPTVSIDAPVDNSAFFEGDTVSFEGSATDPEDGALTGADLVWSSDQDGNFATGELVDWDSLSLGVHAVTLTATDGDGESASDSITVVINEVGNTPPTATIDAPVDGSTVGEGDTVSFEGGGDDPEDGPLTGSLLVWSSSLDGALGTGELLAVDTLGVGTHSILLTATDSGGALGTDSITVTVLAANDPPTVQITAPADSSTFTAGDTITFNGTGSDPEDGPLTGSSLVWQSNQDGAMGNGASLIFSSLSAGLHQVTLTGIDSGGLTGSDTISVQIDPSAANLPPVAQVTGPSDGEVGVPATFDGSGSFDNDGTIVEYGFDFGDGSPVSAGASDSVAHAFAAEGTFTVTLTVTDDDSATGQASTTIDVIIPIAVPEIVDDVEDDLGSDCAVVVDGSDNLHVIYRNNTHAQLWYAAFDGVDWSYELVDGPGFDVGTSIGTHMALAVDAADDLHAFYSTSSSLGLRYAERSGGGWTREAVPTAYGPDLSSGRLGIATDPSQGGRPTVVWGHDAGSPEWPVVSFRASPGVWTEEAFTAAADSGWAGGGIAFDGSGQAWLTYRPASPSVVNWSAGGGFSGAQQITAGGGSGPYMPVVLDTADEPLILTSTGTRHLVPPNWISSAVESSSVSQYDAGINAAGDYWVAHRHGSGLEVVHADPYWDYEYEGPMDSTGLGVAVKSTGEPVVCFFRSGNLMVYVGQ